MLGINNRKLAGSAEKLASGYKINRAADDAAGLSISEKMRKKIRGLERGMENIQDGISLCQVADGALNEVADMIQRMRELSIQAYNGTNAKSDRHIIQEEIDQCINELDRVFETTKFNEIYIFRNGQRVQGETFHPESYTAMTKGTFVRDIPSWLKINDATVTPGTFPQIEKHPGYLSQNTQDITGIMKQEFKLSDDSYVKLYYGSDHGKTSDGYRWIGDFIKNDTGTNAYNELMQPGQAVYESVKNHIDANGNYTGWTPTLSDNVTAKLDFSELAKVTDASNLYNKLSELVGTEISFPCGTCNRVEAVRFSGQFHGIDNLVFHDTLHYVAKGEINLSEKKFGWDGKEYKGYFDAITEVMAMDDTDPNKAVKTAQLAQAIAADLADSTFDTLNKAMTKHYDRAARVSTEPYSVYVYDFRDTDAISPGGSVSANIWTSSKIEFDYEETITGGYFSHYDYWDANQVWIQASDEVGDGIPIHTGHLSAESLNLKGYRVDTYVSEIIMEDAAEYQKRLDAWNAAVPEPKTETYKEMVTVATVITPEEWRYFYEDGELKSELVKPKVMTTKQEERESIRYIYDYSKAGPRPVPKYTVREKYEPSELSILDEALATVSSVRSYYGAIQNRLEHAYQNNYNADENLTYAESRIRDTDMADEMVRNSLLNILKQAGLSMLSQANQTNQGVNMLLN